MQKVSNFNPATLKDPKVYFPMERVGVLIDKLKEQLSQNADVHNMLVTAQLLQSELLLHANKTNGHINKKVSVVVPHALGVYNAPVSDEKETYKPVLKPEPDPAPVIEPEPEPEIEIPEPRPTPKPEPEPIPHFVQQDQWNAVFPKKEETAIHWALDPVLEIPTLAHQEKVIYELNDTISENSNGASLNEKLKENKPEVATVLVDTPVKDLKKAISINDRHRFIHELFRGDETMYERSVKTINSFLMFPEAEYWIQRELKIKLGWDTTLELVKTFDQLVKRRFL